MSTIEESIQALIPRLTEEVATRVRDKVFANLEYSVSDQVNKEILKYVQDIILPAVREDLAAHEAELKAAVIAGIKQTFTVVAEALVRQATEKLASYEGDKLLNQMMGPLLRGVLTMTPTSPATMPIPTVASKRAAWSAADRKQNP